MDHVLVYNRTYLVQIFWKTSMLQGASILLMTTYFNFIIIIINYYTILV